MANIAQAFGFRQVDNVDGSVAQAQLVFVPATDGTAIFIGDAVLSASTGADPVTGRHQVTASTASTDLIRGVVLACLPYAQNALPYLALGLNYRLASTAQYLLINQDPLSQFIVEAKGSGVTAAKGGYNASIAYTTAGSTVTGISGMQLDDATIATTNTLQLRIVDLLTDPLNNVVGANQRIKVRFNEHEFLLPSTGV